MGSRTMPEECRHGWRISWGDFGPDDGTEPPPCPNCEGERAESGRDGPRSVDRDYHYATCAGTQCPCYREGIRDGVIRAALAVRRYKEADLSLLACDLEDAVSATNDPATCSHPFWTMARGADVRCLTCGADVSDVDPMGG